MCVFFFFFFFFFSTTTQLQSILLAHLVNCDKIFLCVIMMCLVSYNSVQNGLVHFYMSVHIPCMLGDAVHQNETLIN